MIEFEIPVLPGKELEMDRVSREAARRMGNIPFGDVGECEVVRRSLDARGGKVVYRYRVRAYRKDEVNQDRFVLQPYKDVRSARPVIVIGSGPSGMFSALKLLQCGLKPVILERGKDVHARKKDLGAISARGILNPDSNFCFGEGGAGTFSDGKLYTRSNKRGDIREVLYQFVEFGADPSILIDAHPHIGSDNLSRIVEGIRHRIIERGGEYHFNSKVTDILRSGRNWKVRTASGEEYEASDVILATGHSARDIYEMFHSKGWMLEAKGFALGVRAEHPQALINDIQYKGRYSRFLPAAEYSLVSQVNGKGVFSFCMCPGGILVPSSTEPGGLVLNGMSNSGRSSIWANSGIVVAVDPEDVPQYDKYGVFSLLEFQRNVERKMYSAVNHTDGVTNPYAAPAQRMTDFVNGRVSADLPRSSYNPGCVSLPLHKLLPKHVSSRMQKAFRMFDSKMRGYYTEEALLLGVESRTSSPVRIPRDRDSLEHPQLPGIYPCGEGAGYAGGIVSSAIDGIRAAEKIAAKEF